MAAISALFPRLMKKRGRIFWQEAITGYGMALPWFIGFLVFTAGPIILSLYYSFTSYQITTPPRFVGLNNFRILIFHDPKFLTSLYNTVYYSIFVVPLSMLAGLTLAILMNQRIPGRSIFRTVFYLPSVVSGVANAMLWLWLLNPRFGLINGALKVFGIQGPPWLSSAEWAKPALILMSLWGVGGIMIIYLASLQDIPRQLMEAAEVDGANALQRFRYITLPLLSPTILFNMITTTIGSFQVFTQAYVWTSSGGGGGAGPRDSLLFYVLYLFNRAFGELQMGYASAMAWVLFLIVLTLTVIQFKLSRRWVFYEEPTKGGM